MKKINKLMLGIISLFLLVFITGCVNKTAISADDFKTKMEEKGYQLIASDDSMPEYITKAYIALASDQSYQIEFYEMSDANQAKTFYENNKNTLSEAAKSSTVETSTSLGNNSKYTLQADGKYNIVSVIDNTAIYLSVPENNKDTINEVLEYLGY